jgi:hypothetical protein
MSDGNDRSAPALAWLAALRDPQLVSPWSLAEWQRVVRLARRLRLLARLAESLASSGLIDAVPPQARRHLVAEQRLSRWRTAAMVWSMRRVAAALDGVRYPLVLLKGAAYIAQDLPIAAGRLPSDLDILVPLAHLPDAQARLLSAGWNELALDAHDRRYYYEWSHEVPPMTHALLATELDLHHNILPPLGSTRVDAQALLQRLRPSKWAAWQVLAPTDQVLHSAAHLFLDSQARDRLRDLVDLDGLLRHFGAASGFWEQLPARAQSLGLAEPLALATHFCTRWMRTPIPEKTARSIAVAGPARARRAWLLPMWEQILMPTEPDGAARPLQSLAENVLLARYHLKRLPLRLLVPHVWHKLRGPRNELPEAPGAADA